jgi:hypothetical protein
MLQSFVFLKSKKKNSFVKSQGAAVDLQSKLFLLLLFLNSNPFFICSS